MDLIESPRQKHGALKSFIAHTLSTTLFDGRGTKKNKQVHLLVRCRRNAEKIKRSYSPFWVIDISDTFLSVNINRGVRFVSFVVCREETMIIAAVFENVGGWQTARVLIWRVLSGKLAALV